MALPTSVRGFASRLLSSTTAASATRPRLQPTTSPTKPQLRRPQLCLAFSTTPQRPAVNSKKGGGGGRSGAAGKARSQSSGPKNLQFVNGKFVYNQKLTKAAQRSQSLQEKEERAKTAPFRKVVFVVNKVPKPLVMGRNRWLRHWTIHRAWQMWLRQQREAQDRMLMRQYQSMHEACEELRLTAGPGSKDEGYLFRVAMERKGVWHLGGVPIEYARPQTETPAREAWDHDWKAYK